LSQNPVCFAPLSSPGPPSLFPAAAASTRWANATTGVAGACGNEMVEETYWLFGYTWTDIVPKWWTSIPIVPGANVITVTTTDTQGHVVTGTVRVTYAPPFPWCRGPGPAGAGVALDVVALRLRLLQVL
jgi:hypothetical protein